MLHLKALNAVLAAEPLTRNLGVQRKPGILSTLEKNGTCYLEDGEVKKILRENSVFTRAGKSDSWVSIFPFEQTMLEIAESYQTARNGVAQGDFKAFKKVIISNTGCGDGPGWHYFTVAWSIERFK